jgi:hypothetical protein
LAKRARKNTAWNFWKYCALPLPKLGVRRTMAMRRSGLYLDEVAEWKNLVAAFEAASRGKKARSAVDAFARNLDAELSALRAEILSGEIVFGEMTASGFAIRSCGSFMRLAFASAYCITH